jgi:hypothetical protein
MMATFFAWMRERSASASWYAFAMMVVLLPLCDV